MPSLEVLDESISNRRKSGRASLNSENELSFELALGSMEIYWQQACKPMADSSVSLLLLWVPLVRQPDGNLIGVITKSG